MAGSAGSKKGELLSVTSPSPLVGLRGDGAACFLILNESCGIFIPRGSRPDVLDHSSKSSP
tara:strand:- start:6 stop:188 length:183 start_codon:yes stop_codon:yes gene_type:complete